MLAESLAQRLPNGLDAVFFASTGAEAVDSAMKFARAATGRPGLISCESSFHGVTLGPLSLVGDAFFQEGFGPLLPGCERVPFGDLARLEARLRSRQAAAFIVEPIQGRQVTLPPDGYLRAAQELCRRYGTLFVIDEIQTGLGRSGTWFALEHWGLDPDVVLVGKALSGGYMPVAAMVTRRDVFQKAVGTLERSYVHQSTYGRNRLSMTAGLATMRIIERDRLIEHVTRIGGVLREGLTELQQRHEIIKEVRGIGLMIGIELQAPRSRVARLSWRLIHLASEGLFPQLIVIPLHRDHGVITMAAGKNDVIKLLPPFTLSDAEARSFLEALDTVLTDTEESSGRNWSTVRDIATETLRRRQAGDVEVLPTASFRGTPVDPTRDVCLITGATGFIGGHLAERLVRDGHQVRCLVRTGSDTSLLDGLGVELAVGDLTNRRSVAGAIEGCHSVLHCGALVSDWATTDEIQRINVTGTRNVLEAAVEASVDRVVHFSTTDVYGHPGGGIVEESYVPTRFSNWYSQTKLAAESEVRRIAQAHALDAVILRPATVFGPRLEGCRRRHRAGDPQRQHAPGRSRPRDRRAVLRREPDRRGRSRPWRTRMHPARPSTSPTAWTSHGDSSPTALPTDSTALQVRWSMPFWLGQRLSASHSSTATVSHNGRTTRLKHPTAASRQAVHVLGRDQHFSNRLGRARCSAGSPESAM